MLSFVIYYYYIERSSFKFWSFWWGLDPACIAETPPKNKLEATPGDVEQADYKR